MEITKLSINLRNYIGATMTNIFTGFKNLLNLIIIKQNVILYIIISIMEINKPQHCGLTYKNCPVITRQFYGKMKNDIIVYHSLYLISADNWLCGM